MDLPSMELGLFKNPNKLPIDQLHLEVEKHVKIKPDDHLPKFMTVEQIKDYTKTMRYKSEKIVIPALDEAWISQDWEVFKFQEYYSEFSGEENNMFLEQNEDFSETLEDLLSYNYHIFWCSVTFNPGLPEVLKHFILKHVRWYDLRYLNEKQMNMYAFICHQVLKVYKRLFCFKASETEYMSEDLAMKYLCESGLVNTSTIVNFCMLYGKKEPEFVKKIVGIYFSEKYEWIHSKETKHLLDHTMLVLEMIGGYICGFEEGANIIPIELDPKPDHFDPYWIEKVVTHLLDIFSSLHTFLPLQPKALEKALELGLPHRLSYFYERVYQKIYELMEDRSQIPPHLENLIHYHMCLGRSEAVETFNDFVSYLLDKIEKSQNDEKRQQQFVEMYLSQITNALEDEKFSFDYNHVYPIKYQIEMITTCCREMDKTRTDYILVCLTNLPPLKTSKTIFECKPGTSKGIKELKKEYSIAFPESRPSTSKTISTTNLSVPGTSKTGLLASGDRKIADEEIEEHIRKVVDALPHLGDGFVLQCLEHYNYNSTKLISDILDNYLPAHLMEIPFDTIRIPEEPEPEQPILAYRGKKETYKDTMELLNDKKDMDDIKDLIIKAGSTYDPYDDEYDDREEIPEYALPETNDDDGVYKHLADCVDGIELVSDPSSSEGDEPQPERPKNAFCEDPAVVRARREARNKSRRGRNNDVVGKPKGQGQDKNVQVSRDKKNVQKSSRANHNRKGGAQWKRSRGMVPS